MRIQRSYDVKQGGALYLVPTPIGNLEDMTFRAVRILQEVDLILAEDTRQSGKLLAHYEISQPMRSFHEHSNQEQVAEFVQLLQEGQTLALISDAGMPLINDPGHPLVQGVVEADIPIIALPGANAALTALPASGLPADAFTYYGFFPRQKNKQRECLEKVGGREETAIFYESPYRIERSVKQIVEHLGPSCPLVIARELTKYYEEYIRGTAGEVLAYIQEHPLKGEIVLLIQGGSGSGAKETGWDLSYTDHVKQLMEEGIKPNAAIKRVAKLRQVSRSEVYDAYHNL